MFSFGEVVVLCVAAAWIFGPNELPRVARHAGRLTGQATGFLYRARAKFFKFAEDAEVTKLHEEMQATMYQLNAIRAELQGGINLFNPGPITQRVLSVKPMPGQGDSAYAAAQQAQQLPGQQVPAQAPAWVPEAAASVSQQAMFVQQQQQRQAAVGLGASFAASAMPAAAPAVPQPASAPSSPAQPPRQQAAQEGGEQHPMMLPVSAVAAGWAPDRAGKAPTGSEIFLDALAEELVAAHVLRFQQQQTQQQALMQQRAAAQAQQQQQAAAAAGAQQQQQAAAAAGAQPQQPEQQHAEAAAAQTRQPAVGKDA